MPTSQRRIQGFDGLRGVACLAVVVSHTLFRYSRLGEIGVELFFTLSGFLIIGMLHESRDRIEHGDSTHAKELRWFWIGRTTRIFPVYYGTLVIAAALGAFLAPLAEIREHFLLYATYTQNFAIPSAVLDYGAFIQSWSLAVEEQFYVIFGFLCLLLPARHHLSVMTTLAAMCAAATFWLEYVVGLPWYAYFLPFHGFAFILWGGIASIMLRSVPEVAQSGAATIALWLLAAVFTVLGFMHYVHVSNWSHTVYFPASLIMALLALGMAVFLSLIALNPGSSFVRMLEWTPLRFLGSISYALYVVHYPVFAVLDPVVDSFGITNLAVYCWVMFAMTLAISIPLCLLSRWLIERPAARLKQSLRSRLSRSADAMQQS